MYSFGMYMHVNGLFFVKMLHMIHSCELNALHVLIVLI
jgi:hypothetical protein